MTEKLQCAEWCGENHCDTNGCVNRVRNLVDPSDYVRGVAYISGPISNMPELNKSAFFAAQATLEARGYEVLNPFELCQEISPKDYITVQHYWGACMKCCVKSMMDADIIFVLDGYTGSTGAMIEWELAKSLHIPVRSIHKA